MPGLANGLAVLRDEESESLWDHITGECFEGPLEGRRMDIWPVFITTVAAELGRNPDAVLLKSDLRSVKATVMKAMMGKMVGIKKEGTFLAPHFRASMADVVHPRLPEGEQGLGVMTQSLEGKFYPVRQLKNGPIVDEWQGKSLKVELDEADGIPRATWVHDGGLPMQLLTRWYGFSFTCPGCPIYEPPAAAKGT